MKKMRVTMSREDLGALLIGISGWLFIARIIIEVWPEYGAIFGTLLFSMPIFIGYMIVAGVISLAITTLIKKRDTLLYVIMGVILILVCVTDLVLAIL